MMRFFNAPTAPTHISPPAGRIRAREELRDLVIEARKTRRPIRVYLVQQSGNMSEFFITSKSRLEKPDANPGEPCSGDDFYKVQGKMLTGYGSRRRPADRYYSSHILAGSFNIGVDGGSHHYAFTNRALAERYSNVLKTDPVYTKYVHDWHAYCDRTFARFA